MRSRIQSLVTVAILSVLVTAPGFAMSIGSAVHVSPGMSAMRMPPPRVTTPVPSVLHTLSNTSALSVRTGPIPLKHKQPGKLNGACYRSCVKTSMGDAFRTDQFCAYSCSLD